MTEKSPNSGDGFDEHQPVSQPASQWLRERIGSTYQEELLMKLIPRGARGKCLYSRFSVSPLA